MEAFGFAIIVLVCVGFAFASGISIEGEDGSKWISFLFLSVVFGAIVTTVAFLGLKKDGYEEGQVDALKGTQNYEIRYVIPQGDSIPTDTLYIKKTD
jgi:hypothetical protein